ncbi:MAG: nucleoside-triphosphatase [Chloroflexota bacterium]
MLRNSQKELLSILLNPDNDTCQQLLVSGPSGCGKTHWCLQLVEEARPMNLSVAGLVSPPVFKDGVKWGIDLLDLRSGSQRRLALKYENEETGLSTRAWKLDPEVVRWGNEVLQSIDACQLLIVDELGPYEFEHGEGLTSGFSLIDSCCYQLACIVIRPSLLAKALMRWPQANILELERENA